jgi:signal transduction histidine kinase
MPFVSTSKPVPSSDDHEHSQVTPTTDEYSHQPLPLARAVFDNEEVKDAELLVHQTNGKTVFVEANAVPVRGDDGAALGAVLTIRDVSAQRQLIREMLEANRSKDEFLAILSHELRTPLTPILGWASLLKQTGGKDPEMFTQAVDAIERNAQLQKRLVNDLLDTTRIVTDKLRIEKRAANLNELVKLSVHSVQDQAQDANVHIEYSIDERLPLLQMDTERIQQVLMNLLSNAIKFSPDNGAVKICTYLQMRRFDHASDTQYALVEVEDRGQGIAPELLPHIFDLFRQGDSSFTRRHGGLGVGLAICKSLVEMHEGTIQALSEGLGRGAIFRVLLPIDKSNEPKA